MQSNEYEKHPKYCDACDAITAHIPINENNSQTQKNQASLFSLSGIFELIGSVLNPSDDNPLDYVEEESKFRCEKCGKISKH